MSHKRKLSCTWSPVYRLLEGFLCSDNVSKRGYLVYQESAVHDKWIKRWFVVRRPYIYIYSNHSETDEQGVINVSSVRIDYNRALEQMIEVFIRMVEWMQKLI